MQKKTALLVGLVALVSACSSTPEPKKTYKEAEVVQKVQVPDRVYFDFDEYDLKHQAKETLKLHVEWLEQQPGAKITVEGHCDERGTREYNLALGQKRADEVKKYLVNKGIASNRIKTVSYGKERPEYQGKGESVWSKNRRAVIVKQTY